jgi:hypothetical protein
MSPVCDNSDPTHENAKFWQATPSGEIRLDVINDEAAKNFFIGRDYYVDFTKVE